MLHIGLDRVVLRRDIVMILDAQRDMQADTKQFLQSIQQAGHRVFCDKPKSVVVVKIGDRLMAYDSPISAATLLKRGSIHIPE